MEAYKVMCYNELDAQFGYECGAMTIFANLTKSVAKSICRHMNKVSPEFISYFVEQEEFRWC